jgi:hypothetical protein
LAITHLLPPARTSRAGFERHSKRLRIEEVRWTASGDHPAYSLSLDNESVSRSAAIRRMRTPLACWSRDNHRRRREVPLVKRSSAAVASRNGIANPMGTSVHRQGSCRCDAGNRGTSNRALPSLARTDGAVACSDAELAEMFVTG